MGSKKPPAFKFRWLFYLIENKRHSFLFGFAVHILVVELGISNFLAAIKA